MNFKVGDKVMRTTVDFAVFKVGDIATVVSIEGIEENNVFVSNDEIREYCNRHPNFGGSSYYEGAFGVIPSNLRLVTPLDELL